MTDPSQQPVPTIRQEADEISLFDLLIVLVKNVKMLLGVAFGAAIIVAAYSLMLPNIYTASARILPPQQNQSSASTMLGQLGVLASGTLGIKNPNDLYVGMLKSRTVADNIIARFKLKELYRITLLDDTRSALEGNVHVVAGRDGIISIAVDDKDAKRAAAMANAYVDELYKLTQNLAVTEASQRRLFFEKQLKLARDELTAAEVAMEKTQQQTGLIKLDGQTEAIIRAVAELRAQVAAKEVQLGAIQSFATEHNPDYVRAKTELTGLQAQLGAMERTQGPLSGDVLMATGKIPEAGLEYARKFRDVKYRETVYELLANQYELAKVDEAKNSSMIQVLDMAVQPERKSNPNRTRMVIEGALVGFFLAVLWSFAWEAIKKAKSDPEHAERMALFRRALKG